MSTLARAPEIAYVGFLSIRNSVLTIKTPSDHVLRVYKLIFEKVIFRKLNNEQENLSGLAIEGLHVDCLINVNLSPWAMNLHYFKVSGSQFSLLKFFQIKY